ncbi:MAG: EAL domain-containing protein [Oscillospiraceae bacterium]|nr:EAL domain-containing protein [Oscillospiraceae bacterium]
MGNAENIFSVMRYSAIRIDLTKNFPVIFYGDNASGRKTKKFFLGDVISAEDLPLLINQIDEILVGNQSTLQIHSRFITDADGGSRWFLIKCEFKKEKFGKIHLDGFVFDVSSYLDFADEDRVLLEYKKKENEKSERINDRKLTLTAILDKDYLRQIQTPLKNGGVFSAIYEDDGTLICSPDENNQSLTEKKYKFTKRVNIRISHVIAAHWLISAATQDLIDKNTPLLDVLVQAVSQTANSFAMLYNEMSNSEHANKLLSEHIEQQILTNNVYNIILERKNSGEALEAVIKLVGEYMGMKRICIYEDFSDSKKIKLNYQWKSDDTTDSAADEYPYSAITKVIERLEYTDMYIPAFTGVDEAVEFKPETCTVANLNGDGKRIGIMTFAPLAADYVPTAQESKVLRSVSQITATLLLQKKSDEKLEETDRKLLDLVFYDPILTIPNRTKLDKDLAIELTTKEPGAAAVMKITNLHTFNELFGHEYTDNMLRDVAAFISDMPYSNLTVYRFSGNTLMLLLKEKNEDGVKEIVVELIERFEKPWKQNHGEHYLDIGIGVTVFPNGHNSCDEVYRAAALALYKATEYGPNSYAFHSEDFAEEADINYKHAEKLRDSITNGMKGFTLKYQPVLKAGENSTNNFPLHFEALINRGDIPVPKLIQLAESMGLDAIIDFWVIQNVCNFCKKMQTEHKRADFSVSVNLTPRGIRSGSIIAMVNDALAETGIQGSSLILEIPQRVFNERQDGILPVLKKLSQTGVRLIIDSFGSDCGGLRLLKHSYMDMVKIDYSLFTNIFDDFDEIWVGTVVKLASSLKNGICVKRVENEEQFEQAKKFGVQYVQGYLYAKPMTAEEVIKKYQKTAKKKT